MNDATDGLAAGGKRLAEDLRELARLEIELAKSELSSKGRRAAFGAGLLLAAALSALLLIATLVTAAILAVAVVVPGWAAALTVVGFLAALTVGFALVGVKCLRSAVPPLPKQAIETTRENVEWLRTRLKSVHR
ncbi:MAG: phage holin family protein [Gaiellaceae bacterium]|jgi:predicted phage tail protein